MDCNKEEASRAKTLAEDKMQNGDFVGAQKLLLMAQRLFSDLDCLPKMLAVCDVHSNADKKINGLDNWYGILQAMHFSDDATIKKQVRKLALLLHPDKNQFPGAEAAFKLVWEASSLLSDKDKRSQYDIKRRYYSRIASQQLNTKSGLQTAPANNASDSNIQNVMFWTCCQHCGCRYKFFTSYVNTRLFCATCQKSYMAYDIGFNGESSKSSSGQNDVRNQGPCNTSVNTNVESTGAQPESVAPEVGKKGTFNEKFNKKKRGGESKIAEVRKPKIEDESMKNYAESGKPEKGMGKMKNTPELQKPQPEVTEPETGPSVSVPDESVPRSDQAHSVSNGKRKSRKSVEEPIGSNNVDPSNVVGHKTDSKDNNKRKAPGSNNADGSNVVKHKTDSKVNNNRKAPRRTQKIPYAEEEYSDDFLSPPIKRSRSNGGKAERTMENIFSGVGSSKRLDSSGSSAPSCVSKGKAKKNVVSGYQEEISSVKDKKSEGCEASREGMVMAGKIDNNHKANEKLIPQDTPDQDFYDFELTTSSFAINQVWSVYDPSDGMPRLYARIDKVLDSGFKLWITWIDPLQDDNSIPIACGIFQDGDSQEEDDIFIFSCQVRHIPRNNNIIIYPRKGEVWAVFNGWNISWSASSENHKRPYEYDYVEVLSNFNDEDGLGVAYLGKVEGFVSLFRQHAQHGVLQLQVPPSEMLRFSHKVPSFKMTGKEREGVPPGCFELDMAALPIDMFKVDNSKVDVGLDSEKPNGKTGRLFTEACKVEVQQANITPKSSLSPKKRQKVHDNHSSFSKASDGSCTNHEINGLNQSRKGIKVVDDLKLRKSPRRLCKTNNQATARSGQQTAEKKRFKDGKSCGQPDGFCLFGEKTNTPKISEKVISTIRKTHRDVDESKGNSMEHGRNVESLSQSRGNGLLTRLNGSYKCSEPETHVTSSCKTGQRNTFNFENQRSVDIFDIDQIWAIYSNDKGYPREYAQIKKIDKSPEFKLHVASLEMFRPPEFMTDHPLSCGSFKLKTGKAEVLVPRSFSHQVKTVKVKNRFDVYPGKGEIWALYKNCNTTDYAETEELEIVEVVESDEQIIQVMALTAKGLNKLLYETSQESNSGFIDIPKSEVCKFSHQIPAFRHERRVTRFGDGEYWELDPKAVLGLKVKNP